MHAILREMSSLFSLLVVVLSCSQFEILRKDLILCSGRIVVFYFYMWILIFRYFFSSNVLYFFVVLFIMDIFNLKLNNFCQVNFIFQLMGMENWRLHVDQSPSMADKRVQIEFHSRKSKEKKE